MERTPKARNKHFLSIQNKEKIKSPDHSTPESSTSNIGQNNLLNESYSPIGSPGRSEHLSQDCKVRWGWKSPDQIPTRNSRFNLKESLTPRSKRYASPQPKRKLIRQKHSDKVRNWAEEFKSLTEKLRSNPALLLVKSGSEAKTIRAGDLEISLEDENEEAKANELKTPVEENISCKVSITSEVVVEEPCFNEKDELVQVPMEEVCENVKQDCLVVELTQGGLNSLKSFPPDYRFPKVPKMDLEKEVNDSDYIILMEDNSMEDEMIKCTQQIEEHILNQKSESEIRKPVTVELGKNSTMDSALNKFSDYVASPKSVKNPPPETKCPVMSRHAQQERKCFPSPNRGQGSNSFTKTNTRMSWESDCKKIGERKKDPSEEEEVMCMLADDSFDNIMLEIVVESEQKISPPAKKINKENVHVKSVTDNIVKNGSRAESEPKTGDSFGMLEDDSLIQPDVLNFLDTVENEAIAASQPLKCTPEEIQQKMLEAKKKLAVGKRKRKSGIVGASAEISVPSMGLGT